MRSTINAAEHAAAATTGSFLSFKARTIATTNPIIAEIRAIVEPFSVEALAVISRNDDGNNSVGHVGQGNYVNTRVAQALFGRAEVNKPVTDKDLIKRRAGHDHGSARKSLGMVGQLYADVPFLVSTLDPNGER
jgi:hypothetical protein